MSKNKRQWTGGSPTVVALPVEPVVIPSCLNCAYHKHNGAYFECRRFPPPHQRVEPNGWCGEHKSA